MENYEIIDSCLIKENVTDAVAIIVPKSVKKIGDFAYADCKHLERLYIPWYVEEVKETNFVDRSEVFKVMHQRNLTIYGEKGTEAERVAKQAGLNFIECTEIIKDNRYMHYLGKGEIVEIPENIEYIGMGAFANTPQVKEITLPQGLKIIDKSAFACTKISKITIPKSVTALDSYIFKNCKNLTEVIFENGETKLDNCCFKGCPDMLVIKAPAGGCVEEYAKKYNLKFEGI